MNDPGVLQPRRILLVDTNGELRQRVAELLAASADAATLDVAVSLDEARQVLAEHGHDVVLFALGSDAAEPVHLLGALAQDPDGAPLIVLARSADAALEQSTLAAGAIDFLQISELTTVWLDNSIRYAKERHQLMRRLLARDREYRQLFAAYPIPMWIYDPASLRILDVNEAACQQYGYSRAEFLKFTLANLRPAAELPKLLTYLNSEQAQQAGIRTEVWPHQRADGSLLDVEIIASSLLLDGRMVRLVSANNVSARVRAESALRRSEATLRGVLNDLSDGLIVVDQQQRIRMANPAACTLMARSELELLNLPLDPATLLQGPHGDELVDARGGRHAVKMRSTSTSWHGEPALALVLNDVTRERANAYQLALLRRAVESSNEGLVIVDMLASDQPVIYVNPALERMTGYRASELLGRNCRVLQGEDRAQDAVAEVREALQQQSSCTVVLRNYRKDGTLFWNRLTLSPVRDDHGQVSHYIGITSDVSEQKFLEAERSYLATHDAVTGLPKYVGSEARIATLLKRSQTMKLRMAVLFVDLDSFHAVNDTLGYGMGDAALRRVAERLLNLGPQQGDVMRYAGDEFLVCIGELAKDADPYALAAKVCESIAEPMPLSAQATLFLTCSVGIACSDDPRMTLVDLVRQADMAANRAKRSGRNTVFVFDNELRELLNDRLALGGRMRAAIARGEFVLDYQPQVSAQDGTIVGVEALVRWNSPEFGVLPPRRFIPVAEDSGVIVQLGLYILRSACRQARQWGDMGLGHILVSVNVSAAQAQRASFVDDVRRILEETGVTPGMLELEITESVLMENADRAVAQMQQLKALGLRLALDDFGKGYSSLSYLRRFPIDKLKIDQAFIENIATEGNDAALVRAMISMGHHLGMRVVAEGVETAAQSGYLRRSHCDEFQGFFYSPPVSAQAVPDLLRQRYLGPAQPAEPAPERTLLLLDDEDNILRALVRLFRRDGYRVLACASASAAFELLATQPVQVILSDQRMPGMSGTEFLSEVKLLYPDTVRMVLSGYTDLASVTDAINRGAIYKFLTKPWDDAELRAQVLEAFRRYERDHEH